MKYEDLNSNNNLTLINMIAQNRIKFFCFGTFIITIFFKRVMITLVLYPARLKESAKALYKILSRVVMSKMLPVEKK